MPRDCDVTKPVLIHVDPTDWEAYQKLIGKGKVSRRIRAVVRWELRRAKKKAAK